MTMFSSLLSLTIFLALGYLAIEVLSRIKGKSLIKTDEHRVLIAQVADKRFEREISVEGTAYIYYISFTFKDESSSEYAVGMSDYRRLEKGDFVRLHIANDKLESLDLDESINGF